jgi:hypothetical protein
VCKQLVCTACSNRELFDVVHNLGHVQRVVGCIDGIWRNLYAVRDVDPALPLLHNVCVCGCHYEYLDITTHATDPLPSTDDEEEFEGQFEDMYPAHYPIAGPLALDRLCTPDAPAGFVPTTP